MLIITDWPRRNFRPSRIDETRLRPRASTGGAGASPAKIAIAMTNVATSTLYAV